MQGIFFLLMTSLAGGTTEQVTTQVTVPYSYPVTHLNKSVPNSKGPHTL